MFLPVGNVGVAKSMLGEIADSTNQSQAFSVFGFAWGIGMVRKEWTKHTHFKIVCDV